MERKHEEKSARQNMRRRGTGNLMRIGLESVEGWGVT